jgi:hypothetical protein
MASILTDERFDFVSGPDKVFVAAFDDEMTKLGYDFGGEIGSGICWGNYMMIYRKSGVKSNKVYARIYLRDTSTVLRFFFSDIDKHRKYIENAPAYIKEVFVDDFGKCQHCKNEKDGKCQFRKAYTIDGHSIEKCNGLTFWFHDPSIAKVADYMALFTEFYPHRKKS